jgi:aryl-alcohol dehydrogenase-like predicted oxidoreductase
LNLLLKWDTAQPDPLEHLRSPNILVIPGTSSIEHLGENLQSSLLQIPPEVVADLDAIS